MYKGYHLEYIIQIKIINSRAKKTIKLKKYDLAINVDLAIITVF